MGHEGKMVFFVPEHVSEKALCIIRNDVYGKNAALIGTVTETGNDGSVYMRTAAGGKRRLEALTGEGLPRIC